MLSLFCNCPPPQCEKLKEEIDRLAPSRDGVGYDTIAKMEYLDMVVCESLRMYPPAVM